MSSDPPLRVLHLIPGLGKGGAERFLLDLCGVLHRRDDVEVVIGSLYDNNQYPELTRDLSVVQLNYEPFSFTRHQAYPEYGRLLEDFRPHVVHTHLFLAEFLSAHHVSEDIAYVCHGHDNMVQFEKLGLRGFLDRERLTKWLETRYLMRRKYRRVSTTFVANSTHTLEYYRRVLPHPIVDDIRLLPYGFDYARFHDPESRPPGEAEPLRIVNVGSFQAKKNQIFIVEIARELRRRDVEFRIDLLGDGEHRARVQAAVDRHDLSDRVRLHGTVDRVEEWLWRSHVYLHTAWYEPFGLVLLEAMAAGLPCVVLDGKGNRDLIQDGRNGYLLHREDAGAFADRIQEVCTSTERYLDVADCAREFAQSYDIGAATERFLALYREVQALRSPPSNDSSSSISPS